MAILQEDHWLCPARAIGIYLDLPVSFHFVLMSFSCLLLVRHVRYRGTLSFFIRESSLMLRFLCWVFAASPIAFVVLQPPPCFRVTSCFPRCLRRLTGDRLQCVLLSFCATVWVVGMRDIVRAFVLPIRRYFCFMLRRTEFRPFRG